MQRLKELDARHKAAARMKIQGKSNDEIHREIGVAKRTLVVWFSDDLMKDYLDELATNVEQEFAQELAGAGMKAVASLVEMLDLPTATSDEGELAASTKIDIARELMDRLPGTAKIRDRQTSAPTLPPGGETNNTLVFANMKNDELAGFLNGGWAAMMEEGKGAIEQ